MKNRNQYSPFFKIKTLLQGSNCFFGFPLSSISEEFNRFEFNPWIQYPKFFVFNSLVVLGFCYMVYLFMKVADIWNPLEAFNYTLGKFGFSDLDKVVMNGYPLIALLSNFVHFIQFKKEKDGFNNICKMITDVNEEIYGARCSSNIAYKKKNDSIYMNLILTSIIMVLTLATYCTSWITIFFSGPTDNLSKVEKIAFCIDNVIINGLLIYPPMSHAAESCVSHLMFELKDSFIKFKDILKYKVWTGQRENIVKEKLDQGYKDDNGSNAVLRYREYD